MRDAVAAATDHESLLAALPGAVRHGDTVVLHLDPPLDALTLAVAWGIAAPVAVSGDVHQENWHLCVAGAELPDEYARRIAADLPTAGRWRLRAELAGRPEGPLSDLVAGASPAYDLRERAASVVSIRIEPR